MPTLICERIMKILFIKRFMRFSIANIFFVIVFVGCNETIMHNGQLPSYGDTLDPLPFSDSSYCNFYQVTNSFIDNRISIHKKLKDKKFKKTIRILAWMNVLDHSSKKNNLFVLSWIHLKDSLLNQCWGLVLLERQCDSSRCQEWSNTSSWIVDYFNENIRSLEQDQYDSALIDHANRPSSRIFITQLNSNAFTTKDILDFTEDKLRLSSPLNSFITPTIESGEEGLHLTAKTTIRERTWKAVTGEDPNHSIPVARFLRELELMNELYSRAMRMRQ